MPKRGRLYIFYREGVIWIKYTGGWVYIYYNGGSCILYNVCIKTSISTRRSKFTWSRRAILTGRKKAKKSSKHKLFTLNATLAYRNKKILKIIFH